MMMTPVTFKKHSGKYNPGETAGFLPERAAKLIASGVAKPYVPPAGKPAADDEAASLARRLAEAEAREADLIRRAAELDAREADVAAKEAGASEPTTAKAEAGSPPAQGVARPGKK
ncbi:hypothetical protein PSM7751_01412 [Pseudooceanicola marinus]|uniref:Uncharacterized protein n=1 Tax=Pseudooceanicola marinus TaxID=396013 RepID=A0A1X6YXZ7_9RHOB|nr:hypothetical protein [Pseudooceanicola marinus]SLN34210.1 hypothetical protein PSM7751_01412 [Pseudooceanicola marinus]